MLPKLTVLMYMTLNRAKAEWIVTGMFVCGGVMVLILL